MKKLFLTVLILLIPAMTWAFTSESSEQPDRLIHSKGKIHYTYNIQEVQRDTDGDGTPDTTFYEYNYVVIDPPVTKGKILEALRKAKNARQEFNPADVETEQTAVEEKLSEISTMTYAQIDTHIENTFGGLSAAQKASLKTVYKAVLALIKQLDLE